MKKFLLGFITAIVLMMAGQVYADDISRIGKKIDGEAKIIKDGKQIGTAIITEGKSYAPVKDLAESFDSTASYTKGVITIETVTKPSLNIEELKEEKHFIEVHIAELEKQINTLEFETIPFRIERGTSPTTGKINESAQAIIDEFYASLSEMKKELATKQAELTEINKQISALESAE